MNFKERLLIFIFAIIFFSASISALQINKVTILDTMNNEVNYISTNNPVLVNLEFDYVLGSTESFQNIRVNAKEIYPDGIYSGVDYSNLAPICNQTLGVEKVTCIVKGLTLKTRNNTINIHISGRYNGLDYTGEIKNTSVITLNIDNTRPKLTFIGTTTCVGDSCYIASDKRTAINIAMQDEKATFTKANIGFRVGTKNGLVDSCEGMNCNGSIKITCSDNQAVPIGLRHDGIRSKDDLGNKVEGTSSQLICDSTPPEIKQYNIVSAVGTDTLLLGKDMIFAFNVTDIASPKVTLTLDAESVLSDNVTSECTRNSVNGADFTCRAVVKPAIDQPGEYEITAVFTDIVGREEKISFMVKLLQSTNETANLWRVSSVEQSSTSFSRPNLKYERTFFAKVNLNAAYDVSIVDIKPEGLCYAKDNTSSGVNSDIVSVKLMSKQAKSIYVKIALRENNDGRYYNLSSLEYLCPVMIYSKKGNYYFSSPEKDNFTIKLELKDDKNLQQIHKAEVERTTKRIEEMNTAIEAYDQSMGYIEMYCRTCQGISSLASVLGTYETLLGSTPASYGAAMSMGQATSSTETVSASPLCRGSQEICKFMTCDTKYANQVTGWIDGKIGTDATGGEKIYNIAGYEDVSSTLNSYKSYAVAVATGCLPAVVYHVKVYSGIQCEYLNCISNEYIQYGQDLSTCQQDKAYSECVYFWGGALDALPFVSMFRDVSKKVGELVRDPVALVGFSVPLICKPLHKINPTVGGGCAMVQDALASTTQLGTISQMVNQFRKASSKSPNGQCASIVQNVNAEYLANTQSGYPAGYFAFGKTYSLENGDSLGCDGSSCLYTDRRTGEQMRVRVLPSSDKNKGGLSYTLTDGTKYDVLFYQGNREIKYGDIYTSNIPTQNIGNAKLEQEFKNLKAKLDSGEINEAQFNKQIGENKDLYSMQISGIIQDMVKAGVPQKAIEAELLKRAEMESKFPGINAQMDKLDAATKEYAEYVKDTQNKLITLDKDIKTAEAVSNYLENVKEGPLNNREEKQFSQALSNMNPPLTYTYTKPATSDIVISREELPLYVDRLPPGVDIATYGDPKSGVVTIPGSPAEKVTVTITNAADYAKYTKEADFDKKQQAHTRYFEGDSVEKIKSEKETITDEEKEKRKKVRQESAELTNEKYGGTWAKAFMTSWTFAQGISNMRTTFNLNWGLVKSHTVVGRFSDFLIEDVSQFEKAFCKQKIIPEERLGDTVILNNVGGDIFRTGAQVGGRRSGLIDDGTKKYYEYWIELNILTSKDRDLNIKLLFYDANGREVDMTDKVLGGTPTIKSGVAYSIGRPTPYNLKDSVQYDKICIKFEGGSLNSYFDHVQGGNTDRICQKIIAE